jgi:hypothetical protein
MFARRQPVIEAMDRAAEWFWYPWFRLFRIQPNFLTGAQNTIGAQKRQRRYRYLPLLLLLVCIAGLGCTIAGAPMAGELIITNLGLTFTQHMQMRSPAATYSPDRDEREVVLYQRSHLWGLFAVACLAVSGCFYFAVAEPLSEMDGQSVLMTFTLHRWWFPAGPLDWYGLAMLLVTVELNVAVLFASWSVPMDISEED